MSVDSPNSGSLGFVYCMMLPQGHPGKTRANKCNWIKTQQQTVLGLAGDVAVRPGVRDAHQWVNPIAGGL
jgi:hypothetical protein